MHLQSELDPQEIALKYTRDSKLGEGTYAVVYRGLDTSTSRTVAIKKIKMGQFQDGLDMSAIREIKFLRELAHPNIVQLIDVYCLGRNIHLVLEFLESDLELVIKDRRLVFMPGDIKSWMVMMLRGLEHCHRCWVLHRDMKPNNLLIASDGQLKIADFGLARFYGDPLGTMTSQVVTRWYRAPELLYGAREYGAGVDMWAVGCIFAELLLRTPFLAGESDMDQLKKTFMALGTPTEQDWPGMSKLPDYVEYQKYPRTQLSTIFTAAPRTALDLLEHLLAYDPHKRITAKEALLHPYFSEYPMPSDPQQLPRIPKQPAKDDKTKKKRQRIV